MDKPRFRLETDPVKIMALIAAGKYRESVPYWTRAGDALWAEKVEPKSIEGKMSCQKENGL